MQQEPWKALIRARVFHQTLEYHRARCLRFLVSTLLDIEMSMLSLRSTKIYSIVIYHFLLVEILQIILKLYTTLPCSNDILYDNTVSEMQLVPQLFRKCEKLVTRFLDPQGLEL
jgi:hypothetical protein